LSNATHQAAVDALRAATDVCVIKVQRRVVPVSPTSVSPIPETVAVFNTEGTGTVETCETKEAVELNISGQPARVTIKDFPDEEGVEEVIISKEGGPLGMSIIGGIDQLSGPFGRSCDCGIFVSKVMKDGKVDQSEKINIGDRLLAVNGRDLRHVTHDDAVESLKEQVDRVIIIRKQEPKLSGHEVQLSLQSFSIMESSD
jgi:hypothetical protein